MKFILILLIITGIFADDYDDHDKRHINKELSHLDLSKEQNKKIKEILKDFKMQLKDFRILKYDIEKRREKLFLKESFNTKEFDNLNYALDTKANNIEKELLQKIHSILNLKQRRKFIYYFDDWEVE